MLVRIDAVTGDQIPLVETSERILSYARSDAHTLIATSGEYMFFDKNAAFLSKHEKVNAGAFDLLQLSNDTALIANLDSNVIRIMKFENHSESDVFSYDPARHADIGFVHSEARISADKKTVMFFAYDGLMVYDIASGDLIVEGSLPDAANIYDQQFVRDESGSRLENRYNDGTIKAYSAADGAWLFNKSGPKPDSSLDEEFFTDDYRIESPLHGAPKVYDKKSGNFVRELESDAYLTYVTQAGEYIVAQYISADGDFFGLLLNDKCETLAYLPYLCDIDAGAMELIFDYPTGNLRKSRIYDKDELIAYAIK
jgi:nitrite reductase/ring-hydroxylating ferredoxin subunit